MYTGFNLQIDKNAGIFGDLLDYEIFQKLGKEHLNSQKNNYERKLKAHVKQKEINGTSIQDEWFPQVKTDIFISHSHNDEELACALAGWLYKKFGLTCFIDSNVWGYANDLLEELNSNLSNKRMDKDGSYIYEHQSCNRVSQHVNMMLSVALQKMIDKVEAVIFLNTENSVKVCSDTKMEETYSPWIYSEIVCTQFIRKKPLLAYRNYKIVKKIYQGINESMLILEHANISYNISLKHMNPLSESDLIKWERRYACNVYEYALDALYGFKLPGEVEKTKGLFGVLNRSELETLQHAYSGQGNNGEVEEKIEYIMEKVKCRCQFRCQNCLGCEKT